MIDALIAGKLYGEPLRRTSKNGNPFVTAKLRISMADGQSVFANIIAFRESVCDALLALADGASVALAGEMKVSAYLAKDGDAKPSCDLQAHEVLTEFHASRRRKVMAPKSDDSPPEMDMESSRNQSAVRQKSGGRG